MEDSTLENILGFLFGKKALDKAANSEKPQPNLNPVAPQNTDYVRDQIKRSNNVPKPSPDIPNDPFPNPPPQKKKLPASKGAMDKLEKPIIPY